MFQFALRERAKFAIISSKKNWEKCAPCTTWKSNFILCLSYQVPKSFYSLLKFLGHNMKSNLWVAHYVPYEWPKNENLDILKQGTYSPNMTIMCPVVF